MSKKLPLITLGIIATLVTVAQADSTFKPLDPVILTANKLPQKQLSTGKTITVISQDVLEKSAGKSFGQLLNEQAGITINGALNNAGTNQSLYLRGAATGRTLILLDGLPVFDPSVINNEFDLNLFALSNVECIEICKGAQSTIYGSDAVAGVINIITVKSNPDKPFQLKANLSAGNYATFKRGVALSGKKGKLGYAVKYAGFQTRGFSSAYDSSGNSGFDDDGYSSQVLNSNIHYQLNPALAFKSFMQYSYGKTKLDAATFRDEKDYHFRNKALITGAGVIFSKPPLTLIANFQYSINNRLYTNDSLDKPGFTIFSKDKYVGHTLFAEVYAKVQMSQNFQLLHGADYRHSSMSSTNFLISAFGPYQSEFSDTAHSQASLYVTLLYKDSKEKLSLDLGGRINVHSQCGSNSTFTINPSYLFNKHYRVFGSIASAFKSPTLFQLYSTYGNRSMQPEKSLTYEVGFGQQHEKIKNRVVYFRRTIKDGIDFNYISNKYFNINEQTVKGIEFESDIRPLRQITLQFNYTFLDSRELSQSRITFNDTIYRYLLRRPKHQLQLNVSYAFKKGLYISIGTKYVSNRKDIGGYKKNDILLADYLLFNAYTEYRFTEFLKLFVDVQNATNKNFYDVNGYNSIPTLWNTGFAVSL